MSVMDELLVHNARYAKGFPGSLPLLPAKNLAVVACMDARLNVYGLLGLAEGDAHVIRNAGGSITDDIIRSLAVSQRLLGTTEIAIIQHTGCGMLTFTDEQFAQAIQDDIGRVPPWRAGTFTDLEQHLRTSVAAVRDSPYLPRTESVRGYVFDISTGKLNEFEPAEGST